jgi:Trk-type K+ transport system membrane component
MALLAEVRRLWNKYVHFLQLHYAYIMFLCFFFSGCFYFDPNGVQPNFVDALFMMVSTSTCTGLNTITISDMSTYQQSLIFISSIFGSTVFINCVIVFVRKHAFEDRFKEIVEYNRQKHYEELHNTNRSSDLESGFGSLGSFGRRLSSISVHRTSDDLHPEIRVIRRPSILEDLSAKQREEEGIQNQDTVSTSSSYLMRSPNAIKNVTPDESPGQSRLATPVESRRNSMIESIHPLDTDTEGSIDRALNESRKTSRINSESAQSDTTDNMLPNDDDDQDGNMDNEANAQTIMFADDIDSQRERARNLRKRRTADRDGEYVHRNLSLLVSKEQLTQEERFNIGGAEYRALHTLSFIVPLYYFCIPVFFAFILRIYFATSNYGQWVLVNSNPSGTPPVDPWFISFFTSIAGFNNVGLLPLDNSVVPFQKSPLFLLVLAFLILVGNTAFALLLRLIIWVMWITTPESREVHKDSLRFLLDHPRRCFTTLFPSIQTWWLFLILFIITVTELIMFLILDFWLPVVADIPWGYRVLDGFFQSVSTRNAGFSVINIADVNPGLTIVYVIAMYISVYPVTISMRRTNVYQVS